MDEFSRKRLNAVKDSRDLSVVELLRLAIDDIEKGELVCDGVVVVFTDRPDDKNWTYETYRANMPSDQEVVALELAKERCIHRWLKR